MSLEYHIPRAIALRRPLVLWDLPRMYIPSGTKFEATFTLFLEDPTDEEKAEIDAGNVFFVSRLPVAKPYIWEWHPPRPPSSEYFTWAGYGDSDFLVDSSIYQEGMNVNVTYVAQRPEREIVGWRSWVGLVDVYLDFGYITNHENLVKYRLEWWRPGSEAPKFAIRAPYYLALDPIFMAPEPKYDWDREAFRPLHPDQILEMARAHNIPELKYAESQFPEIVAAAEPFTITHLLTNAGGPGKARFNIQTDAEVFSQEFQADKITRLPIPTTMPWDDLTQMNLLKLDSYFSYRLNVKDFTIYGNSAKEVPLGEWITTDRKVFPINIRAGFPLAVLGDIEAPDTAKPGDRIRVNFPVRNEGFRGDVGVRVSAPGFERDIMQRVDRGVTVTPSFEAEMPIAERVTISVTPIHLGRNRETVLGTPKVVEISPMNCLLHWDKFVTIRGGYREINPVSGFVAGKNLRITGLDSSVGTGGPPFLPYGGYILSGNLGPGDIATIEYDELYYLKVDTDKGIATARLGALIERATKTYEYSQIPTPSMTLHSLKSVGSLLTRTAPRLEVG